MDNDHDHEDLKSAGQVPWNKGALIGAKPPLRPVKQHGSAALPSLLTIGLRERHDRFIPIADTT